MAVMVLSDRQRQMPGYQPATALNSFATLTLRHAVPYAKDAALPRITCALSNYIDALDYARIKLI